MNQDLSNDDSPLYKKPLFIGLCVAAIILFGLGFFLMDAAPPQTITLATGDPNGAYSFFGQLYKTALAKKGIHVKIMHTSGSVENLELLESGKADFAFVQGGTEHLVDNIKENLRAISAIYPEPFWVFYKKSNPVHRLYLLQGDSVSIGQHQSGTEAMSRMILNINGVFDSNAILLNLSNAQAEHDLINGNIRAAMFISSYRSPTIQKLLRTPGIGLMNFQRYAAYASKYRYISPLVLPVGILDFRADIPKEEITLLSAVAILACSDDLHPQTVEQIIKIARKIHRPGSLITPPDKYPNTENLALPLDDAAETYLGSGESFLSRYLPYAGVRFLYLIKLLIFPFLIFLVPLFKVVPTAYGWFVINRILNKCYEKLRLIETELKTADDSKRAELLKEIDDLDRQVSLAASKVPGSFLQQVYQWRLHLNYVKQNHN